MITRTQTILLFATCIFPIIVARSPAICNQTCVFGAAKHLPYPFGFSSGCPVRLQCAGNGTVFLDEFLVQSVTADAILIKLPAVCDRPIKTLSRLFGSNYAPTSRNGILLQNCTSQVTACTIPATEVETNFKLSNCGSTANNISCYSEKNQSSQFIGYSNVTNSGCQSLFSAISVEAVGNTSSVSLVVQVMELGWWLEGGCLCSDNANCTEILSPVNGGRGFRCQCLEGFVGDGYPAGFGCRKSSSVCNPSKYISGKCSGTARIGVLAGGIAAGAFLVITVALTCCFFRRRSKLRNRKRTTRQLSETTGISIPIYPYKEMEKATNFFSDKQRLGTGAYGTVYAGKLNKDEWVAIKRIKHRDTDSIEQVMNEINLLSSVSHPNLVRLLGCSIERGEQILVYEFMSNGTLSQHLHRERSDGLTWPVRLTIATETAQAVAYLHSAMNPPIYHRDIKSSNILLDYDFKSKVADFGLSRLGLTESSHISTAPQGTPGYLDPQYHQNFHLSDKSDVYSFGVVLVEIITGLKVVDFSRPQAEVNLASLAMDRIVNGRLEEIIDPLLELDDDAWALSSICKVAELAFRCLAYDRDMRPSMVEVAIDLEQIRLSKWASLEETVRDSSKASSSSSSSNMSEKPLSVKIEKVELDARVKDFSPVSVQDIWLSEQSSPSSNSLLSKVVQ